VKEVGSLTSTIRTADQTDQARFWAEGPQPCTRAARELAIDRGLRTRLTLAVSREDPFMTPSTAQADERKACTN
jgi:hypothetical protein